MKKNLASSSQINPEQNQKNIFSQEDYSTLGNFFEEYLDSSNRFEKNVILKMFSSFRLQRNFSDQNLVKLSINEDSAFLRKLRKLIAENQKIVEELKDFVTGLESLYYKSTDRSNYLLGQLVLFGLISGLVTASIETGNSDLSVSLKLMVSVFLFLAGNRSIYIAWKLKRLSSKIKSFMAISKRALDDESNKLLEDFAFADSIKEGLQTEKVDREEILKILKGKN